MSLVNTSCKVASDLHHFLKSEERAAARDAGIASTADLMLDDRRDKLAEGFTEALYALDQDDEAVAEFHALVGKQVLCAAFERDPNFSLRYPKLARFALKWIDTAAEAELMRDAA